jgi:hypothetical protein
MKHLCLCRSLCVGIAIAALFSVAVCAQGQSGTTMTAQGDVAVPGVGTNDVDGLSHMRQSKELFQLSGDYRVGTSPLFGAAETESVDNAGSLPASPRPEAHAMNGFNPNYSEVKPVAGPNALTFHGLTFYGTFDVGAIHETHGATYDSNSPQIGVEDLISKNSNHALTLQTGAWR